MSSWYRPPHPNVNLTKEQLFGELRSLSHSSASHQDWRSLCTILGGCEVSEEELEHEIVPYVLNLLQRSKWKDHARVPEFDWVGYAGSLLSPLVLLCDTLSLQAVGLNAPTLERLFNHPYLVNIKSLDIQGHVFTDEIAQIFIRSKMVKTVNIMSFAMNTLSALGLSLLDTSEGSFVWGSYGQALTPSTPCYWEAFTPR